METERVLMLFLEYGMNEGWSPDPEVQLALRAAPWISLPESHDPEESAREIDKALGMNS